jgi:hypothetical protein
MFYKLVISQSTKKFINFIIIFKLLKTIYLVSQRFTLWVGKQQK